MNRVDVVVTARDEERHLPTCLRSIVLQRGVDLRVIVVDDGSVDRTPSIAREAAASDSRVTIVTHDEAQGLAAARNGGLERATAPWVTFVDGDDFLFPGALRHRLGRTVEASPDVIGVYGDWLSVPERSPRLPRVRRAAERPDVWMVTAQKAVPFIASAPLLRRELVEALGGFDPRCTTAEDAEFWRWWLRLQGRTVYSKKLCVAYRRRAGSMTRRDFGEHFRANRDAFASLDVELGSEAPSAVLTETDAVYRSALANQPRALLAAATAIAEGDDRAGRDVIAELHPTVVRLVGPGRAAEVATETARRRAAGTAGASESLARLREAAPDFRCLLEESAAPAPTLPDLVAAAEWLRAQRRLPFDGEG